MTREELKEMIESSIEQKLLEILGAPDKGLEITNRSSHLCLGQAGLKVGFSREPVSAFLRRPRWMNGCPLT